MSYLFRDEFTGTAGAAPTAGTSPSSSLWTVRGNYISNGTFAPSSAYFSTSTTYAHLDGSTQGNLVITVGPEVNSSGVASGSGGYWPTARIDTSNASLSGGTPAFALQPGQSLEIRSAVTGAAFVGFWSAVWTYGVANEAEVDICEQDIATAALYGCTCSIWDNNGTLELTQPVDGGGDLIRLPLGGTAIQSMDTGFHIYRLDVLGSGTNVTQIEMFVDNSATPYATVTHAQATAQGGDWVFNSSSGLYVILQVDIGTAGDGIGVPNSTTIAALPAAGLTVDYVRAWSPAGPDPNDVIAGAAALTGTGSLTAPAVLRPGAVLAGAGALTAHGTQAAAATLTGTGTLAGAAVQRTTASLTGAGSLTAAPTVVSGYIFNDDFNGGAAQVNGSSGIANTLPNTVAWNVLNLGNDPGETGPGDQEYITNNTAVIYQDGSTQGNLVFKVGKQGTDGAGGSFWPAGRCDTSGAGQGSSSPGQAAKVSVQLGQSCEIRAAITGVAGCWPACWFQGVGHTSGSYPSDYSEFDLQESGLPDVQSTGCTAWGPGASSQQNMSAALTGSSHTTIDTNFHVYRMDYLATGINAYIDGTLVYSITQAAVDAHYGAVSGLNAAYGGQEWPYAANNGMWIILNVAVNSSDTGSTPADASLPATIMTVDYVRVWAPAGPDPNEVVPAIASLPGTGSLHAGVAQGATAALGAAGSLSSAAAQRAGAILSGTGSLASVTTLRAGAGLAAAGSLAATAGSGTSPGAASLTGSGSLGVGAGVSLLLDEAGGDLLDEAGSGILDEAATLASPAVQAAAVSLAAAGSLTAAASTLPPADVAALAAAGSLHAPAAQAAAVSLAAAGSLSAGETARAGATAAGTGSLSAAAAQKAGASLAGTGSLTGAGTSVTTTYYVSTSGSDSASGTSSGTPWQTITKVNAATLLPGDTVLFEGGQTWSGTSLTPTHSGTALQPITYGSYGTGQATLSMPLGTTTAGYPVFAWNVGGLSFQNLTFTGPSGNTLYDGNTAIWLACDGTGILPGFTVNNCTFSNWINGVLWYCNTGTDGYNGVTLTDNTFFACVMTAAYCAGGTTENLTVTGNVAYDNLGSESITTTGTGYGFQFINVSGGTISGNLVHDCGSQNGGSAGGPSGIMLGTANNVTVESNVVYNQSTSSFAKVDGEGIDLDIGCTNCTVQYNIVFGCAGAGLLAYGGTVPGTWYNNTFRYNIAWGNCQFYPPGQFGELTFYTATSGLISDCYVYGNTLIARDNGSNLGSPIFLSGPLSGCGIWNNILYSDTGNIVYAYNAGNGAYTTAKAEFQGNSYWTSGTWQMLWGPATYTSLAAFRAGAGQEILSSASVGQQSDPLLVTPGTAPSVTSAATMISGATGMKLQSGSPCTGAGLNLLSDFSVSPGTRDYFGNALSLPLNIGAYEGTTGIASLAAAGSLTAGAAVLVHGATALTAAGSLTAAASTLAPADVAALAGAGSLHAPAARVAVASLAGAGVLAAGSGGVPAVLYAVQVPADAGQRITMAQPGGQTGDTAPTGTGVALLVFNGGGTGITVTLPLAPTIDGLTIASRTVPVAAGALVLIPVPSSVYGMQPTAVQYSSLTGVTAAMIGLAA